MTSSIRSRRALFAAMMSFTALGLGAAQAEETIKIGGIMSLTGSGASIGKNAEIAWKRAIDDINAAGGILGKKVELVLADTMTDPTHGVSEMRRLIDSEKVQAVVGPATSQETTPLMAIGTEANIAQISSAASTQLTPQVGPYHFSTSPIGENQMIPNIAYALDVLKLKKMALLSDNGGMSKAAVSDIVEYMRGKGVEPVAVQEFAFRTEDMTPQLFSLRNSEAEAVLLINSIGDDARKMLENRYDIGWDVPVLASLTMTNYAVGNATTIGIEPFDGVYSVQFEGMTYCAGDDLGQKEFAKFAAKAKADIPDLDRMGGPSALTPYYIQPIILAAAMNGSGKTDGKSVAAWIESNAGTIKTLTGKLAASSDNHFLPSVESLKVVKNPYVLREDGLVERADCAQ